MTNEIYYTVEYTHGVYKQKWTAKSSVDGSTRLDFVEAHELFGKLSKDPEVIRVRMYQHVVRSSKMKDWKRKRSNK